MDRLAVQVVIARKQEPGLLWTLAVIQLLHPEPLPGSKILLHLSSLPVVPIQLLLVILPLPISMQLSVPQQQLTLAERSEVCRVLMDRLAVQVVIARKKEHGLLWT